MSLNLDRPGGHDAQRRRTRHTHLAAAGRPRCGRPRRGRRDDPACCQGSRVGRRRRCSLRPPVARVAGRWSIGGGGYGVDRRRPPGGKEARNTENREHVCSEFPALEDAQAQAIASSSTANTTPPCTSVGAPLNAWSSSNWAVTSWRSVSWKNAICSPRALVGSQTNQFVWKPQSSLWSRYVITSRDRRRSGATVDTT